MNAVLKFKKEREQREVPKAFFGSILQPLITYATRLGLKGAWAGVKGTLEGGIVNGWDKAKLAALPFPKKESAVPKVENTSTESTTRKPTVSKPDYTANFAGMNFTEAEKKFMVDAGYNPNDAHSVQEFILSQASNADLGAKSGAGVADGYWGDKSIAAFNALRSRGIFAPKEPIVDAPEVTLPQPISQPIPQPVMDAVDPFGYESKGNYSIDNTQSFKTDGIRDWTTMMNYIKGNQDSAFSQDMMHRFGSDLSKWNQKDVESAIGISGNYGRKDRSRIQGFMAGNLAAWNNQRQLAINNYAKKTFLRNQGAETLGQDIPGVNGDLAFIQPTEKEYNWNTWQ